jgi:hypothetical protein
MVLGISRRADAKIDLGNYQGHTTSEKMGFDNP